jgi:hypothetical protein
MIRVIGAGLALFLCLPAFGADCKITEYSDVVNVNIPAAFENGDVTRQTISHTTATDSEQFQSTTRFIRVICDGKSFFVISADGTDPTDASPYLPADTPEYFGVRPLYIISFCDADCA